MATSHIAPPGFQAGPPCFLTYVQNGCYSPFSHVLHLVLRKREEFKTGHLGTWQDDGQGKCQHKRSRFWIGRLSALWVRTHWCIKIGCFWASLKAVLFFPSLWTFKLHKQVTYYQITKSAPEVLPRGILGIYGWLKSSVICGQCGISWRHVEGLPWYPSAWHQKKA